MLFLPTILDLQLYIEVPFQVPTHSWHRRQFYNRIMLQSGSLEMGLKLIQLINFHGLCVVDRGTLYRSGSLRSNYNKLRYSAFSITGSTTQPGYGQRPTVTRTRWNMGPTS